MSRPPAGAALRRARALVDPIVPTRGLTIYGCGADEAARFHELAPRFGVRVRVTDEPLTEGNADRAVGHRCVSVDHKTRVTGPTLRALRAVGVKCVVTRSVGLDHVDTETARGLGIAVRTVAYSPDSVADYTVMLILMLLRDAKAVLRRSALHDYRLPGRRGKELRDLTVGVVGTGRIGTAVVDRLGGFGCRVVAHDLRATPGVEHVPLDELLSQCDVVTLHTPLDGATYHLLDRARIGRLKPDAYVVNTARGALVDTRALLAALEDGRLGGAALDVFEGEEGMFYADVRGGAIDPVLARLHTLPNVVISPHTAYYTDHALRDVVEGTLATCRDWEGGAHEE